MITTLIAIAVCLVMCLLSMLVGFMIGQGQGAMKTDPETQPVKRKRKPSYDPTDLLDPVTPLEQRMEANTVRAINTGGEFFG